MIKGRESGRGLAAGLTAFAIWGLLPLYLRPLNPVGALQIICHRLTWSCAAVLLVLGLRGELGQLVRPLRHPPLLGRLVLSAALVSNNWILYVWSVGHGHVVEASLGYFINPLMNVLLGVVVLRERLSAARWVSVGLAAVAVLWLTLTTGRPPWIALALATTFSLYGLVRKLAGVAALPGLAVETLLLLPAGVAYLIWCEVAGVAAFGHGGWPRDLLLIGSGPFTALPLFLFAYAARLLPYSTLGIVQYLAPSLQLACGLWLYHEPFGQTRAIGFGLIWLALALYAGEGLWRARGARLAAAA